MGREDASRKTGRSLRSQDTVYYKGFLIGFIGYASGIREVAVHTPEGDFLGWTADKDYAHAQLMERLANQKREKREAGIEREANIDQFG